MKRNVCGVLTNVFRISHLIVSVYGVLYVELMVEVFFYQPTYFCLDKVGDACTELILELFCILHIIINIVGTTHVVHKAFKIIHHISWLVFNGIMIKFHFFINQSLNFVLCVIGLVLLILIDYSN